MLIVNPLDEKHMLGFLSPFFNSNIFYKEKWFLNIYDLAKIIGYEDAYFALLIQYPGYMVKLKDYNIELRIQETTILLEKICDRVKAFLRQKAEENKNVTASIEGYQKIVNLALEYECMISPTPELIREILDQNKMKTYLTYLDKDLSRTLRKDEIRAIFDLPYDFSVNRIIFHLAHYRKIPTKYQCRPQRFSFRKGPFLPPMKTREFVAWVKEDDLAEEHKAKVFSDPDNYSMYDILLYKKMTKKSVQ